MNAYTVLNRPCSLLRAAVQRLQPVCRAKEYPTKERERNPEKGLQSLTGDRATEEYKEKDQRFEAWA